MLIVAVAAAVFAGRFCKESFARTTQRVRIHIGGAVAAVVLRSILSFYWNCETLCVLNNNRFYRQSPMDLAHSMKSDFAP